MPAKVIHSRPASVCSDERGSPLLQIVRIALVLLLAVSFSACNIDPEFERLNLDTDCFEVQVAPEGASSDDDDSAGDDDDSAGDDDDSAGDDDDSAGDDDDSDAADSSVDEQQILLTARPGLFEDNILGNAWVTPASGPAGTHFLITVVLQDNGLESGNPTDAVDRITVLVDNGSLTAIEFDLEPSPADESRWTVTMAAGGDPETAARDDRLCLAVYAEIE